MNLGVESEYVEFKSNIAQLDKGIKGLTAMLNRNNKATVYFGVGDDGDVIGMDVGPSTYEKIRNAIRTDIKPRIIANIETLTADNGKKYVSVTAEGYDTPYSYKDMYFIRHASSNESATRELVARMVLARGYDSMREIPSVRKDLTFVTLLDMLSARGVHVKDGKMFLNNLGLLTREGDFNLNAQILADESGILMQVVEFNGMDRTRFLKRTDFGNQCMFMAMKDILDYIRSRNETKVDTSDGQRKDTQLFDYECFREAWINACVHNAWRTSVAPMVAIFDDRMEIESMGGIPLNLRLTDFYEGRSTPVNESLFKIAGMLGFSEHTGRGIPTIVSKYGRDVIKLSDQYVKVVIPFNFTPGVVMGRNAAIAFADLTENESKVLALLKKDRSMKVSEIAKTMGISESAVKRHLSVLKNKGIIRNEGTNRNSKWVSDFRKM